MKKYTNVSDDDIYRYICGSDIVVGNMYRSPLRDERTPSFGLYEENGIIKWKDFGYPDSSGNKAINLLMESMGLGFAEAIKYANTEIKQNTTLKGSIKLKVNRESKSKLPFVKWSDIEKDYELNYWYLRYGIDRADLRRERIYSLDSLSWIGKDSETALTSVKNDPAFLYLLQEATKNKPLSFKVYRPLTERRSDKFRQFNVSGVIEGWYSYIEERKPNEKFGLTIICSSTKERLVLKKAGFRAINPTSEGSMGVFLRTRDLLNKLSERFVIMYDADDPGFEASRKLNKETGWPYVDMRGKLEREKDFSDWIDPEKGGRSYDDLNYLVNSLI